MYVVRLSIMKDQTPYSAVYSPSWKNRSRLYGQDNSHILQNLKIHYSFALFTKIK